MKITCYYPDGGVSALTPTDAARDVFDAIQNEIQNGNLGQFEHADGTPVEFDVSVRILNPVPSPEIAEEYPLCSCEKYTEWVKLPSGKETAVIRRYVGYDDTCGASQRFWLGPDGEPNYEAYDPHAIGEYTEIRCAGCHEVLWSKYLT